MNVCLCIICIYVSFSVFSLQHAKGRLLNPSAVFIRTFPSSAVGVVQVTECSMSDPVYFSWFGWVSEALLVECGCSLDVFTPALANCRPNEIQIWELFWFRVWYWHLSRLHRAVTVSPNTQDNVFIAASPELTHNANGGLVPEGISACVWEFVN